MTQEDELEGWGRSGVASLLLYGKWDEGPGLSKVFSMWDGNSTGMNSY